MSVDIVAVEVGTEVAFYTSMASRPQKRKIAKVHKNGRFVLEGGDEQFTPKRTWSGPHKWYAEKDVNNSRHPLRVYPWSQHFDDQIESEKKRRQYTQKLSLIKSHIERNVRPQDEATIDNLFRLLGLKHEDLN